MLGYAVTTGEANMLKNQGIILYRSIYSALLKLKFLNFSLNLSDYSRNAALFFKPKTAGVYSSFLPFYRNSENAPAARLHDMPPIRAVYCK